MYINGHHEDAMYATVTLDGFPIQCFSANSKTGVVVCYDTARIRNGDLDVVDGKETLPTVTRRGKVRITIKKPMSLLDPRARVPGKHARKAEMYNTFGS